MAPPIRGPLFIECQNPKCGAIKRVKTRYYQRKQRFCSRRCSSAVATNFSKEAMSRGGKMRAHRARVRIRLKVETMAPLDAFRYGYTLGLQSKTRQRNKQRAAA